MKRWKVAAGVLTAAGLTAFSYAGLAQAASTSPAGTFNLQVTPSPLVATVKPGTKTSLQLKIRNAGTGTENLKIAPRSFKYDSSTGEIALQNTPPQFASWLSFSAPTFTVQPGQWFTEELNVNIPKTAGFSYSFALEISRQKVVAAPQAGQAVNGSVAVFTLINVDRPGATSQLKVASFSTDKHLYEYPPVTISVRFNNAGNTILQPAGNIFVQRGATAKTPMATLLVNANDSYIPPGTQRTMTATWNSGFATYQTSTNSDGAPGTKHLVVNWQKFAQFRIGRYTASLVAVYDDNGRDVPVQGTVTFWVIPWRAILGLIVLIAALWWFARWRGKKRTAKAVKRALAAQAAAQATAQKKAAEEHKA